MLKTYSAVVLMVVAASSGCSQEQKEKLQPVSCSTFDTTVRMFPEHAIRQLNEGADPNCVNDGGVPVAFVVAKPERVDILRAMIEKGLSRDISWDGRPLLFHAEGPDVVRLLCENGWDPNFYGDNPANAPLVSAIGNGKIEECDVLFEFGATMTAASWSTLNNSTLSADAERFRQAFPHLREP